MSESKIKFRETLGRYVQVLHDQGVRHVPLDRRARETLHRFNQARQGTLSSQAPASTPTQAQAPVRVPARPAPLSAASPRPAFAVPSAAAAMAAEKIEGATKAEKLAGLGARAAVCVRCPHLARSRRNVVFGEGNPDAELMFIGEAPGADEDLQARPFIGRAGQTLTKMIQAMGLSREQVYIGNILKCRPDMPAGAPGNRKPTPEEMQTCMPYILSQIEIIQPKVMVALGATAVEGLLAAKLSISRLRGTFVEFRGIPLMPTFHPSYLLHNPTNETKRKVWEDLLQVMEKLRMPISEKQRGFFLGTAA